MSDRTGAAAYARWLAIWRWWPLRSGLETYEMELLAMRLEAELREAADG